jgi:thioredoxin 2
VIRVCTACGRKNRVPGVKLLAMGRCGSCKAELSAPSEPIDVGPAEFDEIVANVDVPILVDFWAAWCGPCRMAAPAVKQLARETSGRALVLKVDTESHPELARRFRVSAIPNFVVLRGGRIVHQQPGLADARTMREWLENAVA